MKILITGMTGFVGASLTKSLFHSEHEIIGIVRDKLDLPDELINKYKIVRADISKSVPDIDCDVVIHCAATVSEKVLSFFLNKTNVDGTRNVLNAVPKSAKFIYISSGSVYNLTEKTHFEDDSINQALLTPYGRSKFFAEEMLKKEFPDRDITIVRPRAVYGRGDKVILPRLLKVYKNGRFRVPGDLNQKSSMTNIHFLCEALKLIAEKEQKGINIYNVVDPHEYNLRENIVGLFEKLFDREIEIKALNEYFVRIFAGMRTVLIPGNQFTQTSIDYLTRDHVLSTDKLFKDFPQLQAVNYIDYIPTYVEWINNVGIQNIINGNKRLIWLT